MNGITSESSYVLGVNCVYHQSSAALLRGGELRFAVEQERFSRVKHAKAARVDNADVLPWLAIEACLADEGIGLEDLAAVALSFAPGRRLAMVGADPYALPPGGFGTAEGEACFDAAVRRIPALLAERAGEPTFAERVRFVPHHRAHAAGAFYGGPYERAAVLVLDGIGEEHCGWLGHGDGGELRCLEELPYPHSLGLLWERVAIYCGFGEYGAPKVMGLAAWGDAAKARDGLAELLAVAAAPGRPGDALLPFTVDNEKAQLRAPDTQRLEARFGPARPFGVGDAELGRGHYADVAAALQELTEEAVLACARRLHAGCGEQALVYSGGLALNCVANTRLEAKGPFEALYVPGAAHDAGTAVGAAYEVARGLGSEVRGGGEPDTPFCGPGYEVSTFREALASAGLEARELPFEDLVGELAALLCAGKLVGWFEGRLELGPRALGHRSLLGDPRKLATRQRFNAKVKHREPFRPFAASVLAEAAQEWFVLPQGRRGAEESRELMIMAYRLAPGRGEQIPAVRHEDGSCRIQTVHRQRQPRYHRVIEAFGEATGVPMLLNTSFNVREPIVCSPNDAVATFQRSGIDALVLGDLLVVR